jgi:hypothetical protein
MILDSPYISGSIVIENSLTASNAVFSGNLNITGDITSTEGFTGSLEGTASIALNAISSSHALNADNAVSSSFAATSSFADSFTVAGEIVAQTLNVQQVTSSVVYSSGSNVFGNSLSNTQVFTGSLQVSGSTHYLLGNVGIGTTAPAVELDVAGEIRSTSTSGYAALLSISALGYSILADTHTGGAMTIWTAGSEKMRIGSNGNTSITSTNENALRLINSGGQPSLIRFNDTSTTNDPYIGSYGNELAFGIYGVGESMRIDSSRNIGIGTTDPSYKLDVDGGSSSTILRVSTTNTGAGVAGLILANSTKIAFNDGVKIAHGGGYTNISDLSDNNIMTWDMSNSRVGIGTTSPSTKLEVGNYLDAETNSITVAGRYEYQPQFVFRLGQSGTGYSWNGAVISCGDDGNYNGVIQFKTANAGRDTPTTKMVINSSGNVGIGTTSPNAKLEVNGNIYTTLNTNFLLFGTNSGANPYIQGGSDNALYIGTGGAAKITIIPSGDVGIGTTSPIDKLHVTGNVRVPYGSAFKASYDNSNDNYHGSLEWAALQLGNNGVNRIVAGRTVAGGSLSFYTNNTNNAANYNTTPDGILTMHLSSAGNVGIGTTSPGVKLEVLETSTSSGGVAVFQRNLDAINEYAHIKVGNASYPAYFGAMLATYDIAYMSMSPDPTDGKAIVIRTVDGNVGIGTTNPQNKLHVETSEEYQITWTRTGAGKRWALGTDTLGTYLNNRTDSVLPIYITNAGNIGIGTTSPAVKLQINDSSISSGGSAIHAYGFDGAANLYTTRGESPYNAALYLYNNPASGQGYGTGILFRAKSDVTFSQIQGGIYTTWTTAIDASRTSKMVFSTTNSGTVGEKLTILGNGNIGIGTTSPADKLHVAGNIKANDVDGKFLTYFKETSSSSGDEDTVTVSGYCLYEYILVVNPNPGGSGTYKDFYYGKVGIGQGWNGSATTQYIFLQQDQTAPRSLYPSGGGDLTISAVMVNAGSEYSNIATGTTVTIRFKGFGASNTVVIYMRRLG